MTPASGARQRRWPIPLVRRRSGSGSAGSAGGWGGGDAILSALEGPGRCRSRRGCRVTWHSRRFNARAGAAPPVVKQVITPLIPVPEGSSVLHTGWRAVPAALSSSFLPEFAGSVKGSGSRQTPSAPAHRKCHYRHGPHHLLPLLPSFREEADAHFDG